MYKEKQGQRSRLCWDDAHWQLLGAHLPFGDGSTHRLYYEVGPEGVKQLQQDQQQVEDPPGRVGSNNLPALKQGGV